MSIWEGDLLGYEKIGITFSNLIKSIDTAKVISIEAGFGRGKTFFRKAWSEQLRDEGEIVIEIDVRKSDHSGDPVVTFLGALVEALPKSDVGKSQKALDAAKKFGAVGAKSLVKMALRTGADEVLDALSEAAIDKLEDFDALDTLINEVGDGMSKAAGQIIAAQMSAERVRTKEMPEQLSILHNALTEEAKNDRIVILLDELDRCHPDYAIAVLEAMKLVFDQKGFVFCLMVNADYLESLARHKFGVAKDDESYLDKFVDVRLKLEPTTDYFKQAVIELALSLPLTKPFGEGNAFGIERTASLAGELAVESGFSIRKVKRVLLKVELALRCYSDQPIDAPLLIFLAFHKTSGPKPTGYGSFLPRATITPELCAQKEDVCRRSGIGSVSPSSQMAAADRFISQTCPELLDLPDERYKFPENNVRYHDWVKVFAYLGPDYIPSHERYLAAVAELVASDTS